MTFLLKSNPPPWCCRRS